MSGCEREYTPVFDLPNNPEHSILSENFELVSIDTRLEGEATRSKRDTLDVIKMKIRKRKTSEKSTLTLLPTIAFAERWTTMERKSTNYLLHHFTGTILKDRAHRFGGIYYNGKQEEGSYSLIDLRDAPEDCFEVQVIDIVTIDWFLIDGEGNIRDYLGQTTEYQTGEDRVCAPPGSTEVYRDQGTDSRTVAHIPAWKVNSFLDEFDYLMNSRDEDFIEDNNWIIPYLEEFIEECDNGPSGDPIKSLVGRLIRSFLQHDEEKFFFEWYWQGLGNMTLPTPMFTEVKSLINSRNDLWKDPISTTFLGQQATKYSFRIPDGHNYDLALGTFTFYVNFNGNVIGLYDEYDFDWHGGLKMKGSSLTTPIPFTISNTFIGCTDRGFLKEWETRAVSAAGLFMGAQSYTIEYP